MALTRPLISLIFCMAKYVRSHYKVMQKYLFTGLFYFFALIGLNSCGTTGEFNTQRVVMEFEEVYSPETGQVWMDRNLGAEKIAESVDDEDAFGHLFQWGRGADGHQLRDSNTTREISNGRVPLHGDFILTFNAPNDWRIKPKDNLWKGVNGPNNPCPASFRLPTEAEWDRERSAWSSDDLSGAFASPLKLPAAGFRDRNNGVISSAGSFGYYWSGSTADIYARFLELRSDRAIMSDYFRSFGFSVRCIKD